jgi:phage baseplate assembly protein W
MASEFVGAGWAFPLRTDARGSIALVTDDDEVQEAMRLVIGTAFGERPMRPEFGCAIHDLIFDPSDITTAGRMAYEVRASLERWEPRIEVVDVFVSFDDYDSSTVYIDVTYTIRGSNDPRNLVFPFYVIPEQEE